MAISKSAKIMAEMEKVKAKISDQQARLKELEQKHKEAENEEIVDIVRGMSISLEELPLVLQRIKAGDALGQNVPKSHKGAPAKSDDFVGRGGARERAEFSPQAETELSGLCDDKMVGGRWRPTRIEYAADWYLVGIRADDLNGLRVRI